MKINIGCCGYPVSQKEYVKHFNVIELQSTFYKIPRTKTAERWRSGSPKDFTFVVKAFQGITHPASSPTWRRSNVKPTGNHGNLRPTREVLSSWYMTKEICEILRSPICVIQTPASFTDDERNLADASKFFEGIDRGEILIGFEPRGWREESIKNMCKKHSLIHIVDPFAGSPLWTLGGRIAYLRLHGSPPGKRLYNYTYSDEDLKLLKSKIEELDVEEVYVMFNNVSMFSDALKFSKMIGATL